MDEVCRTVSDISGSAFAVRISAPFNDLSNAIVAMSKHCNAYVVFEHPADDEVSRTHIHMAIVNPKITDEGFKKLIRRYYDTGNRKGNELWSWSDCDNVGKYITYMSKGNLAYKCVKGLSSELIEELRLAWVERTPKVKVSSKTVTKYDEFEHILEDWGPADAKRVTFDEIRSWVFAWFWRRDGRVPPATQYKRMAGTLFLHIAEVQPQMRFDLAMEEVKNLWY